MKKLIKPFSNVKDIQFANALCVEYGGGCPGYYCTAFKDPACSGLPICYGNSQDSENEDDILF